jgi:hypothetical protein
MVCYMQCVGFCLLLRWMGRREDGPEGGREERGGGGGGGN